MAIGQRGWKRQPRGRIGQRRRLAVQALAGRDVADARQAGDQMGGIGVLRTVEQGLGRPLLGQPPGIHDGEAIGDGGVDRHVVGDEHHRRAQPLLHFLDQGQHVLLHQHVERRGRFVGDDEFGLADGGQGNGHALAHAARELVRIGFEHVGVEMQPAEMAFHPLAEGVGVKPHMAHGEIVEGMLDPAHRVQHVHRALHDVAEIPPARLLHLVAAAHRRR